MYLRGVFQKSGFRDGFEQSALTSFTTHVFKSAESLPSLIRDNMTEIFEAMNKGVNFKNASAMFFYTRAIQLNQDKNDYNYYKKNNIYAFDDDTEEIGGKRPRYTVPSNIEVRDVRAEEIKSWVSLGNRGDLASLDFKDEIQEYADIYNATSNYLESTYGMNMKTIIMSVAREDRDTIEYIKDIMVKEGDEEFMVALDNLMNYEEFYDYLKSSAIRLRIDWEGNIA